MYLTIKIANGQCASMNVEILARIQFALTISFHYIYPPLSIGLSTALIFIEGQYLRTGDVKYKNMAKFWVRVFGLTFAVGVATGLVQALEFGTNWASYSRYVGDVFGSALGAEGIFAFLMESGFLGVLLFGWDRVGRKTHFFATVMVAFGAIFSGVWIVVANSWMQTPAGFEIVGEGMEAHAVITSFWAMVFNPTSVERLIHVMLGAWLGGAFLIISISAYYLLKQRHMEFARFSMKVGLFIAVICVIAQPISGDSAAQAVVKYQPAKLAAMEGLFKTQAYAPMFIFGAPDPAKEKTFGLSVPGLLSLLSFRNTTHPVLGLEAFPKEDWPNTQVVFQTYRLMIYMWGGMFATAIMGWIFWRKIRVGKFRSLLWLMIISVTFPQIANQAGWYTTEMGRQPWIVYNLLRTSEGLSKVVSAGQVLGSIIMFAVLYVFLFGLFIFLLDRKIKHGPGDITNA